MDEEPQRILAQGLGRGRGLEDDGGDAGEALDLGDRAVLVGAFLPRISKESPEARMTEITSTVAVFAPILPNGSASRA